MGTMTDRNTQLAKKTTDTITGWGWSEELYPDYATQVYAFLGRRGTGKSYGSGVLAESMLDDKIQIIVLDPVGTWWGLRLLADGASPGYSIPVIGGAHGDLPLTPTAGEVVANMVVDTGSSVILDISEMRKGERKRFATLFAEQFFYRKKRQRGVCHVFVEEAHLLLPQKALGPEDARMLGAMEDLFRLGRNYGIGGTMIDQRPQSVNKDALNQAECLAVFQLVGPQERDAIKKWTESKEAVMGEVGALSQLQPGFCYLWSPQWLSITHKVRFRPKKTYDASATPKAGHRRDVPDAQVIPIDLGQLEAAMAAATAEVADNDPKALKKRIVELDTKLRTAEAVRERLERELAEATSTERDQRILELQSATIEDQAKRMEGLERAEERLIEQRRQIREAFAHANNYLTDHIMRPTESAVGSVLLAPYGTALELGRRMAKLSDVVMAGQHEPKFVEPIAQRNAAHEMTQVGQPPPARIAAPRGDAKSADPILVAIRGFRRALSTRELAILCGYSDRTVQNKLVELRKARLVETVGGAHAITPAGAELVGRAKPWSSAERIERWKKQLDTGPRHVFELLLEQHRLGRRNGESTAFLASACGYSERTVQNALVVLRGAGLMLRGQPHRLNPDLFTEVP